MKSNKYIWAPLLEAAKKAKLDRPIYTVSYKENDRIEKLEKKLDKIRGQYHKGNDGDPLTVDIIGHSLGGITALQYKHIREHPTIIVRKVVAISSRLQTTKTFFAGFSIESFYRDLIPTIKELHPKVQDDPELCLIGGDHDDLVPQEALFVHRDKTHLLSIKNRGHLSVMKNGEALTWAMEKVAS